MRSVDYLEWWDTVSWKRYAVFLIFLNVIFKTILVPQTNSVHFHYISGGRNLNTWEGKTKMIRLDTTKWQNMFSFLLSWSKSIFVSPIYINTILQTTWVNYGQRDFWYVCITLRLRTVFPFLMKITHELNSKQSVKAGSTPMTCMYCDMSTWLAVFIPAQVVTDQPSMTAVPVTKVN